MTGPEIIELYFSRDERAVTETRRCFGALMRSVAGRVLRDGRDAEEAVSDACLAIWSSVPPNRPDDFGAYAAKLTRNAAIDRLRKNSREKRGGGEAEAALEEVSELASSAGSPDEELERREFIRVLNSFLGALPKKKRTIFVQRYWYLMSCRDIAREQLMSEAAVRMTLSRIRSELKEVLIGEGLYDE